MGCRRGWWLAGLFVLSLAGGCAPAAQGPDAPSAETALVTDGLSPDAAEQTETGPDAEAGLSDDTAGGPEPTDAAAADQTPDQPADQIAEGPEMEPEAEPEPETPIMARQRRDCAAQGGQLQPGGAGLFVCARNTRDSGQRCSANSECEGLCLARSETCAPFTPLFGCHEVLMAPGTPVTQCLN